MRWILLPCSLIFSFLLYGCDYSFDFDWMGSGDKNISNNHQSTTEVSIIYPSDGQIVKDSVTVELIYIADFEISRGMIYFDYPDGESVEATFDSVGHFSYIWGTEATSNGLHELFGEITSYSGNVYRSQTISVDVQN